MKIAVPTNDGLYIMSHFEQAKGTLVISVESGEIIREEMRWNKLSAILTSPDGFLYNFNDCDIILVSQIGEEAKRLLTLQGKEVTQVNEPIINSAIMHFIRERVTQESNYCCCP